MSSFHRGLTATALAVLVLSPCAAQQAAPPARDLAALDSVTSGIMTLPVTTTSDSARADFLAGVRESDLGRPYEAHVHFSEAVAADSGFALAYLGLANTATSLAEFKTNLDLAEHRADSASDAERWQIQIARAALNNDVNSQLSLAQQLVEKYPDSPRAWLALANVQGAMNHNEDARASILKAVGLAPRLLVAHTDLGNSYLFGEPKDFAQAREHFGHAAALAPNEPYMHDLLGDANRALNDLARARAEYTRGHELNPRDASFQEQRGHVNSFAGRYAAARADYDSAIALGHHNEKALSARYRAYVSLYAGQPQAAAAELSRLVDGIDTLGVSEPRGLQIATLADIAMIAIDTRDFAVAEGVIGRMTPLLQQQADEVGTDAFRRGQEENIAYWNAWLAARKGDYIAAHAATDQVAMLAAPQANPRKLEPVHELEGFIALYQDNFKGAAAHFAQGNLDDPYIRYQYATALAGAGDTAKAKELFRALAVYNFNGIGYALIRNGAKKKAS
jgi:Flp pilus assembly protein TadD